MLVDPESYDELARNRDLLETLKNIAIANEQHENGESRSAKQVYNEIRDELVALEFKET